MIGLCIAESCYLIGKCRIEYFEGEAQLNRRRAELDQSCTTWILGQPVPKRKVFVGQ